MGNSGMVYWDEFEPITPNRDPKWKKRRKACEEFEARFGSSQDLGFGGVTSAAIKFRNELCCRLPASLHTKVCVYSRPNERLLIEVWEIPSGPKPIFSFHVNKWSYNFEDIAARILLVVG